MKKTLLVATAVISLALTSHAAWRTGLLGGFHTAGAAKYTTPPAYTNVFLDCHAATNYISSSSSHNNWNPIWSSNRCWQYWGQVWLPVGTHTFAGHIDDNSTLVIGGTTIFTQSGNSQKSGTFTAANEGWFDFEFKCGNGTGGAGPWGNSLGVKVNGNTMGFGVKWNGQGTFQWLADPGDRTVFRYDDGTGFEDQAEITGEPLNVEVPGVSYGIVENLAAGPVTFSVPSGVQSLSASSRATCAGYRLYDVDLETAAETLVASGSVNTVTFTHVAGKKWHLAWLWQIEYRVTAAAGAGGSASPAEQWVDSGATATVTATSEAGRSFYKWMGDVPAGTNAYSTTLSFTATAPAALTASFGDVYYVKEGGSDANGGTSWDDAFATPKKALAIAKNGSIIYVGRGTYVNSSNCDIIITNAVHLIGVDGAENTILEGNAASSVGSGYIYDKGGTSTSTWRWVMEVRNAEAFVSGFTIQGGFRYNPSNQTSASGLQLYSGTVENCIIRRCRGGNQNTSYGGAGVYIASGGTLRNCEIYGNNVRYNNSSTCYGGGLLMVGGLVENCVVSNNSAGYVGAGVSIRGGTLRNSLITDNHGIYTSATAGNYMSSSGGGAGIYMADGAALVENCVISNNTRYTSRAAGVYMNHASAVLRNCLVASNTAKEMAGGILLANGRVEHCTIAGNASINNGGDGTGLRMTGGTAVNNVIYGNPTTAGASDTYVSAGTFKTNLVTQALSVFAAGDGNVAANPLFRAAAHNDYTLKFGSPAIDAANPNAAVKADLAGTARPQGAASDLGCYEFASDGGILCAFDSTAATYLDSASPTFTASVVGASGEVSYAWYLDGVLQPALTGATSTFPDVGYGRHTVKLVVTDGVDTAEFEAPDVVSVAASTAYVSTTGSNDYPYETQEKAARSIQDAIDAVIATDASPGTVIVGTGTYYPDATSYFLTRPVRVISSDGPGSTTITARNPLISNCRRAFLINNPKALVSGFTMNGGSWYNPTAGSGPGSIWLYNGTVSNCVFRGNHGDNCGGAVRIENGLLTHCVVTNNTSYYSSNVGVYGQGGGVYMTGGEVAWCEIRNNQSEANSTSGAGCGIWMSNGYMHDCVIAGNAMRQANNDNRRGQGLYMSNGLVERCVITNNFSATYIQANAGGVCVAGGTLRNCLIAGNRVKTNGGGIYQTGGTVEFCTITGNTSDSLVNGGLYLNGANAVFRYNILHGNGAGTATEPDCNVKLVAAASFATNVIDHVTAGLGTDNIYDPPLFANAGISDYTLSAGSPAIDAAVGADWVADDLACNVRPTDGNGNGTSAPDLGCYEAPDASAGALRCSFSPDSVISAGAQTVTFTASVSGTGSDGELTYVWTLPGAVSVVEGGASVTATYPASGAYTVTLDVTAQGGATASSTIADCVKIGSPVVFVNAANENSVWPFASWETAATNLQEVFDTLIPDASLPIRITVTNGTYALTAPYTMMSFPVHLVSVEGPEKTTIRAASANNNARSHFRLTHADTLLAGFTLSDARIDPYATSDKGAASLRISAGVVSNCVVTGSDACRSDYGAVHVSGTGLLTHTVIRNSNCNKSTSSGAAQSGAGLALSGNGVAAYCVISNCYAEGAAGSRGGGAYVMGGVLRDSEILNCATASSSDDGGALSQTGGLVERCVIGDSATRKNGGAAIYQTGGTVRNCLIKGFVAKSATQVLQLSGSGSFVNCTVVTNGFGTAAASPVAATIAGGSVSNCVFAINNGGDVTRTSGTVAYSRFGEADGANGNTARDPTFRNPAAGDYTLRPGSPCRNTGSNAAFDALTDTVDLAGNPRLFGKRIDMGCYELQSGAGTMLLLQ